MRIRPAANLVATLAGVALLFTSPAFAHGESDQAGGFLAGLAHPVAGLDHVLAMIAVGLWGTQLGKPALWVLPVAFPIVMALGGLAALLGLPLAGVELGIAVSAMVLGGVVAGGLRAPLPLALAGVAAFAVFHGYAHGAELRSGQGPLAYSAGFVIATGLLHAVGIGLGILDRLPRGAAFVRGLGAVIACGGAVYLWRAIP
jgi:urease accessory protein